MKQALTLNTNQERSTLKSLKERFPNSRISPAQLRVAHLAENAKGLYTFNLRKDVGNTLVHDRKLDVNDSFVATRLGVKLLIENPAEPGTGLLQSYPNSTEFNPVVNEVVLAHLNAFYNANLRYKKDDLVEVEAWPTQQSLVIPQTQKSAAGNFSQAQGDDGVILLPTTIGFDGAAKNEITLDVPAFPTQKIQHVTAATRIYVVFVAYGFLITGQSRMSK